MATFFGEVIFSTSRSCHADAFGFYDDDDEEEEINETKGKRFEIQMTLKEDKPRLNSVLISFGLLANEFLQGCLHCDCYREIGKIHVKKTKEDVIDTVDFHPRLLKSSSLYVSSKGALICFTSEDVSPDLATDFTKEILSIVDASCPILVLSSYHTSKLLETDIDNGCVSYSLQSPAFSCKTNIFRPLPQPLILDSVPAAVMTLSVIEDRPCLICSSYVETVSPGNVDLVAEDFQKVIGLAPFSEQVHYDNKLVIQSRAKSEVIDRYM